MGHPLRAEDLFHPLPHPVETIANLDAVPIQECGEPLVPLDPGRGLRVVRPMRLRATAVQKLRRVAEQATSEGFSLLILDAYRHPARQRAAHTVGRAVARAIHPTWPPSLIRELANKYVAAPDAIAPPPHTTGGAVDLTLIDPRGKRLPMGTRARTDHPAISAQAQENRERLRRLLEFGGFSNYEEEWWHWSYGDSGWALRSGQPYALYGKAA